MSNLEITLFLLDAALLVMAVALRVLAFVTLRKSLPAFHMSIAYMDRVLAAVDRVKNWATLGAIMSLFGFILDMMLTDWYCLSLVGIILAAPVVIWSLYEYL